MNFINSNGDYDKNLSLYLNMKSLSFTKIFNDTQISILVKKKNKNKILKPNTHEYFSDTKIELILPCIIDKKISFENTKSIFLKIDKIKNISIKKVLEKDKTISLHLDNLVKLSNY